MDNHEKNEILIMLSESESTAFGKQDFTEQSIPQKVFSSIWALESEVNNGGFSQYFQNCSNETAGFVLDALHLIDAQQTAEICKRALKIAFPLGLPSSPVAISAAAENFAPDVENALDELSRDFFLYPNDLTELLYAYVSAHPDEFGSLD
jgi:hypothetical protein